jgi:glycolate oxidase FAD binding subunit
MSESTISAGVRSAQAQVAQAISEHRPVNIAGGGSRSFIGRAMASEATLHTNELSGVISYEPSELVLRVGAGTPVREICQLLAENGQYLPFEPHDFGGQGLSTIGGLIASGLSGSARPWSGAARDYLLGLGLINGRAEVLNFGGQVMKNVAGYDVSRMMVGSLGCFGLITEASFKVLPLPEKTVFYTKKCSLPDALTLGAEMSKAMSPVSGFAYVEGQVSVRLQGSPQWLEKESELRGLIEDSGSQRLWRELNQHTGSFFESAQGRLWRISVPKYTNLEPILEGCPHLVDWVGAQYWLNADRVFVESIVSQIEAAGGYVTSFNQDDCYSLPALHGVSLQLHQRMKHAYDDSSVFNPKRLCLEF